MDLIRGRRSVLSSTWVRFLVDDFIDISLEILSTCFFLQIFLMRRIGERRTALRSIPTPIVTLPHFKFFFSFRGFPKKNLHESTLFGWSIFMQSIHSLEYVYRIVYSNCLLSFFFLYHSFSCFTLGLPCVFLPLPLPSSSPFQFPFNSPHDESSSQTTNDKHIKSCNHSTLLYDCQNT